MIKKQNEAYSPEFFNKSTRSPEGTQSPFAERLRNVRKGKVNGFRNWSQERLSRELNTSKSTYGYYENSKSLPDASKIAHIASLYNVSADYLLGLTDDPNPLYVEPVIEVNFSEKCICTLKEIASSKMESEVFERLILNKGFSKLLRYIDTYLTFSHRIDAEIKEEFDRTYIDVTHINLANNRYILPTVLPEEKVKVSDIYLAKIEETILKIMKEIARESSYEYRKKLKRIIELEYSLKQNIEEDD